MWPGFDGLGWILGIDVRASASVAGDHPVVVIGRCGLVWTNVVGTTLAANSSQKRGLLVYIADRSGRNEVAKRHKVSVCRQVTEQVNRQRNQYAHGTTRSWASGITEDQLWEPHVVVGMTPPRFLDEFRYPAQGNNIISGKYDGYVGATKRIHDCLGGILQQLEGDISVSRDPSEGVA